MGLLSKIGSLFSGEEPDPVQENVNIDKIVEYMTERMGGIENRMEEMEGRMQSDSRSSTTRIDELYNTVW